MELWLWFDVPTPGIAAPLGPVVPVRPAKDSQPGSTTEIEYMILLLMASRALRIIGRTGSAYSEYHKQDEEERRTGTGRYSAESRKMEALKCRGGMIQHATTTIAWSIQYRELDFPMLTARMLGIISGYQDVVGEKRSAEFRDGRTTFDMAAVYPTAERLKARLGVHEFQNAHERGVNNVKSIEHLIADPSAPDDLEGVDLMTLVNLTNDFQCPSPTEIEG